MTTNKSCTEKVKRLELKWNISCHPFLCHILAREIGASERACVREVYFIAREVAQKKNTLQRRIQVLIHYTTLFWALDENKGGWAAKTSSEGSGGKTTYYFPFHTSLGFASCFHSTSAGRFETHRKPPATKTNCRSGKFKGFVMLFIRVACLLKP